MSETERPVVRGTVHDTVSLTLTQFPCGYSLGFIQDSMAVSVTFLDRKALLDLAEFIRAGVVHFEGDVHERSSRASDRWTHQLPTRTGHYWWRTDTTRHATIVHVQDEWLTTYGSGSYRVADAGGQWFGPLEEPGGDVTDERK